MSGNPQAQACNFQGIGVFSESDTDSALVDDTRRGRKQNSGSFGGHRSASFPPTIMKTNLLFLSFRQVAATDRAPAHLVAELRVDGARLGDGYVLDISQLSAALTGTGEFFIFTCGCGEAGCAGIHEGVHSQVDGDAVMWTGNLPKGGAFSVRLSAVQARKAVFDALVAVAPLAVALDGPDGYPIGPEGRMDRATLARLVG
jgi:hypothetical protein